MGEHNYDWHSMAKNTKCWCPKHEKFHTLKIFWTGRGVPRKFCAEYQALIDNGNVQAADFHNAAANRSSKGRHS